MNRKIAIYTCVTGGYDVIHQPAVVSADVDYICFVPYGERTSENIGVWRVVEFEAPSKDSAQSSRFPKMMPHLLLQDYDYSLYIDANVELISNKLYDLLGQKIAENAFFCAPPHPFNDCVYDEAKLILKTQKDTLQHILKAVHFLKGERFPAHWGLYENNIILRQHSNPVVVAADELWWNLFQRYPKRDQLLLTYCLKKSGISIDYLFPSEAGIRNTEMFSFRKHPSEEKKSHNFLTRKLMTFPKLVLRIYLSI